MRKLYFFLFLVALIIGGIIFHSCQKEEIQQTPEMKVENLLKNETGYHNFYFDQPVCVNEVHEFCLDYFVSSVTNPSGKVNVQKINIEILLLAEDEDIVLLPFSHYEDAGPGTVCFTYLFDEAGEYTIRYIMGGKGYADEEDEDLKLIVDILITVENCNCPSEFLGETECGDFGDFNRKVVYAFTTELASEFKIQGGLTNFTGDDFLVEVAGGDGIEINTWIPGASSNRIISVTGGLDDCGEVEITVYWYSTNTDTYITGKWSVELDGVKIWEIDPMMCDESGVAYPPVEFVCGVSTITDVDGNEYATVPIGNQCWMKQNLKTTKYSDGSDIDYPGSDNGAWEANTTGAYAWYYNNPTTYKDAYGALYTFNAVNTGKLCPGGWHVPSDNEWKVLEAYLGMTAGIDSLGTGNRGTDEGKKLKEAGFTHWKYSGDGSFEGTDEYGFTALPGGLRFYATGAFTSLGNVGIFWTSYNEGSWAFIRILNADNIHIGRYGGPYNNGQSVRCVKD